MPGKGCASVSFRPKAWRSGVSCRLTCSLMRYSWNSTNAGLGSRVPLRPLDDLLRRTTVLILAARFASEVDPTSHPRRRKGARDAGSLDCRRSLPGPAGLTASRRSGGTMLFDEAPSGISEPQVRQFFGVPHA